MVHTIKKSTSLLTLSLLLAAVVGILPITPASAQQGTRRIYLEEFTGAWCGYCVRGAYAIQQLYDRFPGQVVVVSIHNDQGSTANDMMDNVQGDSMVTDVGFPSVEALQGFPDGWTARMTEGANWNVDPGAWADSVQYEFGETSAPAPGIIDGMLGQPAVVQCNVDSVSYNQVTNMVTVRVSATFTTGLTGDFRLNLMVTEDSVSGSGAGWDQHNYYSNTDASVGGQLPNNPMYNYPESIPGWKHMHVFREAVGGIHGVDGIIPQTTGAGSVYSKTFTFPLPATVQNRYYVNLIGLVNQYSAQDSASNQVFDAMEVPLLNTPHAPNNFTLSTSNGGPYYTSHAGGDTTISLTVQNNGSTSTGVKLTAVGLPSGWSGTFSPSDSLTIKGNGNQAVTLKLTSPQQAGFATVVIQVAPQEQGVFIPVSYDTVYALSDNTKCPLFYDPNAAIPIPDALLESAIPDSLKQFTAEIPLSDGVVQAYPPEQYPYMIFDNVMLLDNGGDESQLPDPSVVDNIKSALNAGGRIFISSDYALGYAFDESNAYFAQFSGFTETQDVQSFYQQIGLDFTSTTVRFNSSSGADLPFAIKGETNDPVGDNLSGTDKGGYFSCVYSIDSASSPSFYSDGKTKNIIGSDYIDPATGGRLVYLGFGLPELSSSSVASSVAKNAIDWLLAGAAAGVNPMPSSPATGITASPNPFHGATDISYTAAQGEENVTLAAYDVLGREVAQLPMHDGGNNTFTASFDGSSLPTGTYVIIAHSSKGSSQVRVVNQQ